MTVIGQWMWWEEFAIPNELEISVKRERQLRWRIWQTKSKGRFGREKTFSNQFQHYMTVRTCHNNNTPSLVFFISKTQIFISFKTHLSNFTISYYFENYFRMIYVISVTMVLRKFYLIFLHISFLTKKYQFYLGLF